MPRAKAKKSLTRGERVCAFLESYCIVPEGPLVGEYVRLADFQRRFILDVYDNPHVTTDAYLSIARKNAKTSTIACLVLAHLVGPEALPNSEIVSGARSRDQAAKVYNYAEKMVRLNPDLSKIVRAIPSKKKLIGLPRNVEYTAIAAEAQTAHGGSPVLAILDEVGQVQGAQDAFVDAITTSQGAYERPLLIAISTQAATDADLFSVWIDDARKQADPQIVCHVYEAPADCDVLDEEAWKAANPALGLFRSEKDLRKQANKASRMPSFENTFRNLCLNQRVSIVSPLVPQDIWKLNGEAPHELDVDLPAWAGLDLSGRTDLTALVIVQEIDGVWQVHPHFWTPEDGLIDRSKRDKSPYDAWARDGWLHTTPGATVDYGFVAAEMAEILGPLNLTAVAFDRWRMDILEKELQAIGLDLPLQPFGQGFRDMSPAIDAFESEMLNVRLAHGMHPVLTMCAANAIATKDPAGNRKLDKHKATGRIDGMVALAMAIGQSAKTTEVVRRDSIYNEAVV